jgi:hypothetical protein
VVNAMGEARRGRIARDTYLRTVGQMLTRDWFALDRCDILTQLEIVEQLVAGYPTRYLSRGAAVRFVLDKAIGQVVAACRASSDSATRCIAEFLEARQAGKSVAAIAREWRLSREYVSRAIGRRAIALVTDRVLVLGRRKPVVQPPNGSVTPSGKRSA